MSLSVEIWKRNRKHNETIEWGIKHVHPHCCRTTFSEVKTDQQLSPLSPQGGNNKLFGCLKLKSGGLPHPRDGKFLLCPCPFSLETAVTGRGAALWTSLGNRKPLFQSKLLSSKQGGNGTTLFTLFSLQFDPVRSQTAELPTSGLYARPLRYVLVLKLAFESVYIHQRKLVSWWDFVVNSQTFANWKTQLVALTKCRAQSHKTHESSHPWAHHKLVKAVSSDNEQWHHKQKMNL